MTTTRPRTLVVVPAFNERDCLPATLAELAGTEGGHAVVVVDDGSRDDTAQAARAAGVPVLQVPFNLGVGGAMRTGFLYAQRQGFDVVVQLDADGQHDPADVVALVTCLQTTGADVVVGARFDGVGDYAVRGPRRWAMTLLARAVSRRTGTRLTDVTSGFRAAGPRAVALFAAEYPADYLGDTVESLLLAHAAGLRIAQHPVRMRRRRGGRPSTRPLASSLYLLRAVLVLVVFLSRRRKRRSRA